ncbi:hypothetical protein [Evansella cellulosilytica]|uniref:Uncharacterized protein n=1 Tax=Evansella cellulosilytica (strain ATCC 21833 / DSM 2522 / FERM P-1141 / JCM 9156 / N-4) TaxID=649639 RepID=E6TR79_EVAC2|nr:hypothetical protein [Evansella cellulosilytica]ADU30591.1 hypothetical protein Bcell_2332 [Evansella cellulosilytica DSM 2522]
MKNTGIFIFVLLLLSACSDGIEKKELNRDAEIVGYTYSIYEEKQMALVHVDDYRNENDSVNSYSTEYAYAYIVELTDETAIVNEDNEEIELEELSYGNVEIWVKEEFIKERTKVNFDDGPFHSIDTFPVYTAEKVKYFGDILTEQDVLNNLKSYGEGMYTAVLFFDSSESYQDNIDEADEFMDLISKSHIFETGSVVTGIDGPTEDALLLGIDQFPSYVLFDTDDVIMITGDFDEIKGFTSERE